MYVYLQLYNFRKRPLPADDDAAGKEKLAGKLLKYNVSMPEYILAFKDTDVPW